MYGLAGTKDQLLYDTVKAAIIGLTRNLAVQHGADGIRANAVCPGHILTERINAMWDEDPDRPVKMHTSPTTRMPR